MIQTIILNENPLILYHQVFDRIFHKEAEEGTLEGIKLVKEAISKFGKFNLILDMTDHEFCDIECRRIWSVGFKENSLLRAHVERVAVVGDDTQTFHTEKEMMETEVLRFFTDVKSAFTWLCPSSNHLR